MARSKRSKTLAVVLVVGVVLLGGAVGLFTLVGALLVGAPTRPEVVADLHPPIEDRTGRRLDPARCGLNQVRTERGCERAVATAVVEEEVRFASRIPEKGIAELTGALSIPTGLAGPRPGVVILAGSGPNLRDGASPGDLVARYDPPFLVYRTLAAFLAEQGLVVLRYDKRVSPAYRDLPIDYRAFRFDDQMDDAHDAVDYLASRPEVDGDAIVVLGHSEGGMMAPHVARGDPRVAAVILMSGTTQTLGRGMVEQIERLGEVRKRQGDYVTQYLVELNLAPIRRCYEPIWDGTYDPDEVCLGGVTQQALADFETLAQGTAAALADLDAPVMAIQGSVDLNIDPLEIPRMQQAILAGRDAEVHYVRGLDHSLTDQLDPADPVAFDEEALRRFEAFLASVPWEPPAPAPASEAGGAADRGDDPAPERVVEPGAQ